MYIVLNFMILSLDYNLHSWLGNVELKIMLIGCILGLDLYRNILWAYLLFVLCWLCIGFRGRGGGMGMRKVWGLRRKLFLVEGVGNNWGFWYFYFKHLSSHFYLYYLSLIGVRAFSICIKRKKIYKEDY